MDDLDLTEKTPRTFDDDDLRDEVPHRAVTPVRAPRGTKSNAVPPLPAMRLAAAPPSKLIPFLPPPEPQSPVPGSFPVVAPMSVPRAPDPVIEEVEIDVADEPPPVVTDDKHVALPPVIEIDRAHRPRGNAVVMIGIAAGALLVGTMIGLVILSARRGAKSVSPPSSPTPAVEVAATTPAAAPAPVSIEPLEEEPVNAGLAITSQPDGAMVTLIANGDATVVGRTPITAPVDPALSYDVVFALRDHPTVIRHIDAAKVHELAVDLTARPRKPARRTR